MTLGLIATVEKKLNPTDFMTVSPAALLCAIAVQVVIQTAITIAYASTVMIGSKKKRKRNEYDLGRILQAYERIQSEEEEVV